jgi:hypothetical protein
VGHDQSNYLATVRLIFPQVRKNISKSELWLCIIAVVMTSVLSWLLIAYWVEVKEFILKAAS